MAEQEKETGGIINWAKKGVKRIQWLVRLRVYRGYELGASVYDPVFVMAAVLEWAGIAKNGRGELILTNEYKSIL